MRNLKTKLLPLLLAFVLIFSVVPITVGAQSVVVSDEASFREAVANGGEITLSDNIIITQTVYITKDTVINMGTCCIELPAGYIAGSAFCISGADVTIKCKGNIGGGVRYNGIGSTYKLEGVGDADTSLTIIGGGHLAQEAWYEGDFAYPKALIEVTAPDNVDAPSVNIIGANCTCNELDPETGYPMGTGALITGKDENVVIKSGSYFTDISKYVAPDSVMFDEDGCCKVLELSDNFSDKFASILNQEGNITMKRYKPVSEFDFLTLYNALYNKYMEESCDPRLEFHIGSYNYEDATIYASLLGEDDEILESHKVKFDFIYDRKLKTEIDELVNSLPKGEDIGDGYYEPYIYKVTDLEVVNYWLTCGEEIDNTNQLINYSDEFKKYMGYKNFKIETGAGDDDFFYTFAEGDTDIGIGDTVYATTRMGVQADHVIYVSDETENTADAVRKAAQKRIDDYIGKGKATLIYNGTVYETLDEGHFDMTGEHLDPNLDFETETGIDGVTGTDHCFTTEINGIKHYLMVLRNSEKMSVPIYKSVDIATEISVSSDDSSVPLDTMIEVEKLTEGTKYNKIIEILGVKENETFDIKLYSDSIDKYVTKLTSGKFEVKIPISEKFEGKDLIVYYIDQNDNAVEYEVTVEDESFAVFQTNHFSVYTLAELPNGKQQHMGDTTGTQLSPETGDKNNIALWITLLLVSFSSLVIITVYNKKRKIY